jgi:hypothetical protein
MAVPLFGSVRFVRKSLGHVLATLDLRNIKSKIQQFGVDARRARTAGFLICGINTYSSV